MSHLEKDKSKNELKKIKKASVKLSDEAKIKKEAEREKQQEEAEQDDNQKGIIPEGMDFKKFLGCGG